MVLYLERWNAGRRCGGFIGQLHLSAAKQPSSLDSFAVLGDNNLV
jgi:hypothetical protein